MRQAYEDYTEEDFLVWKTLFERQMNLLLGLAENAYLEGIQAIEFEADRIPNFDEVNPLLKSITGWQLSVVKGLIPNKTFFELLNNQFFPSSTWFRKMEELDYLEEPDMFHDVFGHVPLLSNHDFCGFLQGLSRIALKHIDDEWAIEILSRIYWHTVEFGLINTKEGLRIYGAGILSSTGESTYSLKSDIPERVKYDVEHIFKTPYIKDKFQEKYFVINSYRELYGSIPRIEELLEKELMMSH